VIGNDVWLGYRALVLPRVTVGHGAVVAAASVVTADVDPCAVVAVNPARVVRRRFDEEDVGHRHPLKTIAVALDVIPTDRATLPVGARARSEQSSRPAALSSDSCWGAKQIVSGP
jgi:carbonic anhydrase/acetyltransferase-like protein (isoleucine patch superfamily)